MMKKMLFLMLFLAFWGTVSVSSQVRIGGDSAPVSVAILDLNPDSSYAINATKGLALPRVALVDKSSPAPMSKHQKGLLVYNMTVSGDLKEGLYFNNGTSWNFVPEDYEPITFLRSPNYAYLGIDGSYQDTLLVELSMTDKSNVKYQWYQRLDDGSSQIIPGATKDTLFVTKGVCGINQSDYIYKLYCVAVNGYQYGVSGQGGAVYGIGVQLSNSRWLKVKPLNLGATLPESTSIEDMIAYTPSTAGAGIGDTKLDPTVYGDWYQWSRAKDGHEKRAVWDTGTFADSVSSPNGLAVSALDPSTGQVTSGKAVGKFIQRPRAVNFDWRQYNETAQNSLQTPQYTWTWGKPPAGMTTNDPCHTQFGYPWHVPTLAEIQQMVQNNTFVWVSGNTPGYKVLPGPSPKNSNTPASVFFPASGRRNAETGTWLWVNADGGYYTSTAYGANAWVFSFSNTTAPRSFGNNRVDGLSIRCVSE